MAEIPSEYQLAQTLLKSLTDWYIAQLETHKAMDRLLVTRLTILALSQYGATLGVDVGMTADQFTKINEANFKEAYDRAPKFG